jgi:hypothetical protein
MLGAGRARSDCDLYRGENPSDGLPRRVAVVVPLVLLGVLPGLVSIVAPPDTFRRADALPCASPERPVASLLWALSVLLFPTRIIRAPLLWPPPLPVSCPPSHFLLLAFVEVGTSRRPLPCPPLSRLLPVEWRLTVLLDWNDWAELAPWAALFCWPACALCALAEGVSSPDFSSRLYLNRASSMEHFVSSAGARCFCTLSSALFMAASFCKVFESRLKNPGVVVASPACCSPTTTSKKKRSVKLIWSLGVALGFLRASPRSASPNGVAFPISGALRFPRALGWLEAPGGCTATAWVFLDDRLVDILSIQLRYEGAWAQ